MKGLIKKFLNIIFNSEDTLIKELDKQGFNINLLDIGAAGNIEPRWLKIAKYIKYIGIEPDDRSNKDLCNNYNCKSYQATDNFLWDKQADLTFYICKKPTCSSLLKPNLGHTVEATIEPIMEWSPFFPFAISCSSIATKRHL